MSITKVNADVLDLTDDYAFTGTITGAGGLALGTEQATTSGTSKTFGSIPSGTKRITINFVDVSSNGTTPFIVQIGDAGGIETTGYSSSACRVKATPVMHAVVTACFLLADSITAGEGYHGRVTLELEDSAAFTWTSTGALTGDADPPASGLIFSMGSKSLSAELTQVLIQLENGSDAFDAGAINITYE